MLTITIGGSQASEYIKGVTIVRHILAMIQGNYEVGNAWGIQASMSETENSKMTQSSDIKIF